MCKLTRRQLFLGGSGLILFGCGDSTTVEQATDYYPVSQKVGGIDYVLHWGKNNTIIIDTNASGSPEASQPGIFQSGANEWTSTLQEVEELKHSSTSPNVKVNGSQVPRCWQRLAVPAYWDLPPPIRISTCAQI